MSIFGKCIGYAILQDHFLSWLGARNLRHRYLSESEMGFSEIQWRSWSFSVRGATFLGIAGVVALALARLPSVGLLVVAAVLWTIRFIQNGTIPSFSLKTILLATGLVACGIVLKMAGDPWKEVHRFSGNESNVAMSPDGKLVAASQGTTIEIRETQTGRSVQTIKMAPIDAATKVNQKRASKIAFTLDGKSLMTVDWQTYPSLFSVSQGEEIRGWPKNSGICPIETFGNRFVANSTNPGMAVETCNVYDVQRVEPILTIASHNPFCRSISPTGSRVLVGKDNSTAELWNVDEQLLVGTIPIPQTYPFTNQFTGPVFTKFSCDGKFLAVPTSVGVDIWNVTRCRKVAEWNPQKFQHLTSLVWAPDDTRLVASFNEVIVPSGRAIGHCFLLDQNYQEIAPISGTNATFSPSVDRIATTSANGLFLMLDGSNGESIAGILGRPMEMVLENPAIHFSPDGDWLFVNGDPTVYHRERSEFWYGYYQLPAFWGMVFFLTAMIESIYVGRIIALE